MFIEVKDVALVSDETIKEIVSKGWNAGLSDILSPDNLGILKAAKEIETEAEKIAFAIRNRYNNIIENEDESDEDYDEDAIDEFMNNIADELGQEYNGEYEYRPDYFWIPSTC